MPTITTFPARVLGDRSEFFIASQDFFAIRSSSCTYVDKTLFLKEFLSHPKDSNILITRPRRFGKSLLLSMIRYFCDKRVSSADAAMMFTGTLIAEDAGFCEKHRQQYVVIHLDFRGLQGVLPLYNVENIA